MESVEKHPALRSIFLEIESYGMNMTPLDHQLKYEYHVVTPPSLYNHENGRSQKVNVIKKQ